MKTQERKRVIQYFLFIGVFLILSFTVQGVVNAPITTVGPVCNAVPGQNITVPITVTGFNNIIGFYLALDYEYSKLQFVSGTNNSLLEGTCNIGDIDLENGFHRLTISWYYFPIETHPSITLPDGIWIANYVFKYISGPATLHWFDMGPSCAYNGPGVSNILNDTPQSMYYINGFVFASCQTLPTLTVGTIINPVTCGGTGTIPLTFTNVTNGTYTINYDGGNFLGIVVAGNAATITASTGIYNNLKITVNSVTSASGVNASVLNPAVPLAPTISNIIQPTCADATGSVVLNGLPAGNWTINPGAITGNTTSKTISGLAAAKYNFTVTNAALCISPSSADVVITAQPGTPLAPTVGIITQPTCADATGSVVLNGLPAGNWAINPGAITGNTTSKTISGLAVGKYNFTVTTSTQCVSTASADVVITAQPIAPLVTITNPSAVISPATVDLTLAAVTDGSTPGLEFTYWIDADATNEYTTPKEATLGTYYIKGTVPGTSCFDIQPVEVEIIPQGTTQLSYRFSNPEITNVSGDDYFEFDVEVKSNENSYFWIGNVNLDFNKSTLSSDPNDWSVLSALLLFYSTPISISGSNLDIDCKADIDASVDASASDFAFITTDYQTLFTVRAKITDQTGVAGINFNEGNMNGKQFYYLSESPWVGAYQNPKAYDPADFVDTYVGRVYASKFGWTQVESLNWNNGVNTSVWEGDALVPVVNASNLRIHNPAQLTIPVDGELTITGNIDIKPANGLIIESDASGTGSLITGSASGKGSVVANRYMTTDAWHLVASPVSGQNLADFLTSNANVATDGVNADVRGIMDYNPADNVWNDYFTNLSQESLATGKGFCIRTNANSVVTFTGLLQAGTLSVSGLTPDKWNCIGNPYTSAIGITSESTTTNNFLDANALSNANLDSNYGAIYIWDQPDANNEQPGLYSTISNAYHPDNYIQQGQAFLIKMNTTATAVDFNAGMQIHDPVLALKSTKNVWPTIKLEGSVNSQKSSTIIAFNNEMTKGLDPTYDAGLLKGSSDLVIYSRLVEDNGIPFAIQALPANDYSSLIIPIGIDFKTGGDIVFSALTMNLPSNCMVILEDKLNQSFTDLSKDVYSVTVAANSSNSDRFRLHTSYLSTGTDMSYFMGKLSAYAIRNVEIRVKGQVSNQAIATLYDIQGREILVKKLNEGSFNVIRTPNIKSEIYLLFINDNRKSQVFKIPVRE